MDGDDRGTPSFQFRVLLERDDFDGGWVATCLDLPGCVSQGETDKEAVENLADAIGGVLTVRMQDHLPEALRKRTAGDSDRTYQVALSV